MFKIVVMPWGLASGIERAQIQNSQRNLQWGLMNAEEAGAPDRRGLFAHDFTEEELTDPIFSSPLVELRDDVPADWRPEDAIDDA
jgi:hypothetical protein